MIVNVRCYTCGSTIGDKWRLYQILVQFYKQKTYEKKKSSEAQDRENFVGIRCIDRLLDSDDSFAKDSPMYLALQDLRIENICCRNIILTTFEQQDEF